MQCKTGSMHRPQKQKRVHRRGVTSSRSYPNQWAVMFCCLVSPLLQLGLARFLQLNETSMIQKKKRQQKFPWEHFMLRDKPIFCRRSSGKSLNVGKSFILEAAILRFNLQDQPSSSLSVCECGMTPKKRKEKINQLFMHHNPKKSLASGGFQVKFMEWQGI